MTKVLGRAGPSVVAAKISTTHSLGTLSSQPFQSQPSHPGMCNDGDHRRDMGNGHINPRRLWGPDHSNARPFRVPMAEAPQRARGRMRLAVTPRDLVCPLSSVLAQARHSDGGTDEGSFRQSSGVSRTGGRWAPTTGIAASARCPASFDSRPRPQRMVFSPFRQILVLLCLRSISLLARWTGPWNGEEG